MIDLSIIIVNWNSAHYLRKCLSTIYSETKDLEFEIIVVDNASYDGCEQLIKDEFPGVIFVQSTRNIGFAKANNLGFKHSSGKNLLFLNPDTEVIGPAIGVMYSYLESLPNSGAVGCKLLNSDLSIQMSCIKSFPRLSNQFIDIELFRKNFPKTKLWGNTPLYSDNVMPKRVDVISGACLMVKKNVFEKVGLFSPDYFMYSEDVDLCYKIRRAKYHLYYIGESTIIHHGGGSRNDARKNFDSEVIWVRSRFTYFKKIKGEKYARLYKILLSIVSVSRLILVPILLASSRVIQIQEYNFYNSFQKWIRILRWTRGKEAWVEKIPDIWEK